MTDFEEITLQPLTAQQRLLLRIISRDDMRYVTLSSVYEPALIEKTIGKLRQQQLIRYRFIDVPGRHAVAMVAQVTLAGLVHAKAVQAGYYSKRKVLPGE